MRGLPHVGLACRLGDATSSANSRRGRWLVFGLSTVYAITPMQAYISPIRDLNAFVPAATK